MKIFEFISKHCQDLVDAAKASRTLIDLAEFPHDAVVVDSLGNKVPVVVIDCVDVPVSDFLTLNRDEFLKNYNLPSAPQAFDNYISAFEILEGEDAVMKARKAIEAEKKRLEEDVELVTEL